eukprot:7831496-Pyramimonas_sp.AAC.1
MFKLRRKYWEAAHLRHELSRGASHWRISAHLSCPCIHLLPKHPVSQLYNELEFVRNKGSTCSQTDVRVMFAGPMGKPRSRLSASQWQSVDMEYTSNIPWNIRNDVR